MIGVGGDDVHTLMLSASWATAPKIWHAARAMDVSLKETIFAFETVSFGGMCNSERGGTT